MLLKVAGSSVLGFDESELCQCLDPARCVSLNHQGFVVDGAVPVMYAPFEHEEDGSQDFVADSDDCAFVPPPHNERLELRFEPRGSPAGGMCEFAQQAADIRIAFAKGLSDFLCAGR